MIDTGCVGMGAASVVPQSAAMAASAGSAADTAPSAPKGAADPGNAGAATTRTPSARVRANGAQQENAPSTSLSDDFAALLAGSAENAATAPAAATDDTASAANDADTDALPDRLLALLDASWLPPSQAAAPSTQPAAATPQIQAGRYAATPGIGAGGARLPGITEHAATATPADITGVLAGTSTSIEAPSALAASPIEAAASVQDLGMSDAPTLFPVVASAVANTPAARSAMSAPLAVPADPQAGFDDGLGARLAWMAEQRLGHAEIRLNPEHLGPIEVRVQVDGSQVNAEFHSAHANVRQAIEASVPRLRELLGQQGLQLGQADVGQRHANGGQPSRETGHGPVGTDAAAAKNPLIRPLRSRGLIDEYA